MLAVEQVFANWTEGLGDVLLSFRVAQMCLACSKATTSNGIVEYRQTDDTCNAFGNLVALVVATLALASLGKRDRDNGIDGVEEVILLESVSYQLPHFIAYARHGMVFKIVDDVGIFSMRMIEQQRCSFINRQLLPEKSGKVVVGWSFVVISVRKIVQALIAYAFLVGHKSVATHGTRAWGNDVNQARKERHNMAIMVRRNVAGIAQGLRLR